MLFNSYIFVLLFLPIAYLGHRVFQRSKNINASVIWLIGCSFLFYAWWNPAYLPLIIASIVANYLLGEQIAKNAQTHRGRLLLIIGIVANLLCLAYFKYTHFILENLNAILGTRYRDAGILLPLAISFFTFQQIAYLVDTWSRKEETCDFRYYCLFVVFFPHLLAGPLVNHREMIPQFRALHTHHARDEQIAIALTVIGFGLFKKVIIADNLASYSIQAFQRVHAGESLSMMDAWIGTLSFTLQIYFDFSAYSDIACGTAFLFGVRLPQNFASPYQARSLIQLWLAWNMTLTKFINRHVYMPLVRARQDFSFSHSLLCIFFSMVLVGLWHGANWNCILFGVMHGTGLVINHIWRHYKLPIHTVAGWILTLLWWSLSLVIFRTTNLQEVISIYHSMINFASFDWEHTIRQPIINDLCRQFRWDIPTPLRIIPILAFLFAWTCFLPNQQQLFKSWQLTPDAKPETGLAIHWRPTWQWMLIAVLALVASIMALHETTEFIYFQF